MQGIAILLWGVRTDF